MVATAIDRLRRIGRSDVTTSAPPLHRAILGAAGGFVATLVMTGFRLPISRSLPPTADFWARYVGDGGPEDYPLVGLVLHLAYGAGGGVAFAALAPGWGRSESVAEAQDAALGTAYGLLLSVFGSRVVLGRLLGMELDDDERLVFHVSHVVYGLTLGTWLGSRFGG